MAGPPEYPAVDRRRVRLALRKAREARGLTQSDAAAALSSSLSKVQRIESGEVAVSGPDLRVLLNHYGVTDPAVIADLATAARVSRRQRYAVDPAHREHLTPAYAHLLQFEAVAVEIRTFQLVLVPGPMQTPEYAEALLGFYDRTLTPDERRVRFDVRMQRRRLLEPDSGVKYLAILDESVMKREIGGLEVMARQLEELAALSERPNVMIRVVPLREGAMLGTIGPFTVVDLDGKDPEDAVIYRESFGRDILEEEPGEVSVHRAGFEKLWARAWSEELSTSALLAEAAQLRFRNDSR
ncbi:helix-turn-helix transcriptional regulator [Actinoplanes sp. NPDC051633]|uniref:helix-turn-helix domain-containing protein n=1 Tax=Actinoplanes sp. NPDC051633 TaxID=3155670 RepID=UPI003417E4F3